MPSFTWHGRELIILHRLLVIHYKRRYYNMFTVITLFTQIIVDKYFLKEYDRRKLDTKGVINLSKKIQVTVEESVHEWFKAQANNYGISVSGMVNIAMAEYRQQKEVMGQMPLMMDMLNKAMSSDVIKAIQEGANNEKR